LIDVAVVIIENLHVLGKHKLRCLGVKIVSVTDSKIVKEKRERVDLK
jgi:hypothetical protein